MSNSWSIASKIEPSTPTTGMDVASRSSPAASAPHRVLPADVAGPADSQVAPDATRRPRSDAERITTGWHVHDALSDVRKSPERATVVHDDLRPADRTALRGRRPGRLDSARDLGSPGAFPLHARHPPDRLPRQALDDAAVRRLRHAGGDQPRATRSCSRPAAPGLSVAFDLPTLMGRDPDHPLSLGEVGKCGVSVASLADMETLFDGHLARRHHDVDDDQLAGGDDLRDVPGRGRAAGRRLADAVRHDPERHPQGVHRAEGVHLPAAAVDAAHHRHLRVLRDARCRGGTRSR